MIVNHKGRLDDNATEITDTLDTGELGLQHNLKTVSVGTKNGNIVIVDKEYVDTQTMVLIETVTESKSEFVLSRVIKNPNAIIVQLEGFPISEYTITDDTVTLDTAAEDGEQVCIIAHNG